LIENMSRARRNAALAVIGVLVLLFAWHIREVLNPLILGYLLAAIVHPMVVKLEGRGLSRRRAVNLIFIGTGVTALLLAAGFFFEGSRLVREVVDEREQLLGIFGQIDAAWARLVAQEWVPQNIRDIEFHSAEDVTDWLRERFATADAETAGAVVDTSEEVLDRVGGLFGTAIGWFGLLFLVPLYTYFLLFELGRIHRFVGKYLPKRDRARIADIGRQIGQMLASFFRGRLVVCVMKGLLITAGLFLADVDYAFLFGMGSGFLSLVPVIGPLVGWLLAFLVGVLDHGVGGSLVRTGLVFWLAEMIEGYVLVPKIIGDSLGLHPVVVLFAVLAGGAALGLFGMLIALPLTAAIVILVRELVLPALESFAEEDWPSSEARPPES
jgi:predicted PurR-regulated permease PerM